MNKGITQKIFTGNYPLTKVQELIAQAIRTLGVTPILNGTFVDFEITTPSTDTPIQHLLNKQYQGWWIVTKDAASDVYESTTVNSQKDKKLILKGSSAVTGRLYVF